MIPLSAAGILTLLVAAIAIPVALAAVVVLALRRHDRWARRAGRRGARYAAGAILAAAAAVFAFLVALRVLLSAADRPA